MFWWQPLERQVRIEGAVVRTTEEESDAYFATRPRGSQLGAWASEQSQVIAGRGDARRALRGAVDDVQGPPIPRPPHWGGYRVIPLLFEFWQGRPTACTTASRTGCERCEGLGHRPPVAVRTLALMTVLLAACASTTAPRGLHIDDGGRGDAVPVLFVHGNSGNLDAVARAARSRAPIAACRSRSICAAWADPIRRADGDYSVARDGRATWKRWLTR